jgi:hypothetical protein
LRKKRRSNKSKNKPKKPIGTKQLPMGTNSTPMNVGRRIFPFLRRIPGMNKKLDNHFPKNKRATYYIPEGYYCYDEKGLCPFWELKTDKPPQRNGYCHRLGRGDWEVEIPPDFQRGMPLAGLSLLWDQVKECGKKLPKENLNG